MHCGKLSHFDDLCRGNDHPRHTCTARTPAEPCTADACEGAVSTPYSLPYHKTKMSIWEETFAPNGHPTITVPGKVFLSIITDMTISVTAGYVRHQSLNPTYHRYLSVCRWLYGSQLSVVIYSYTSCSPCNGWYRMSKWLSRYQGPNTSGHVYNRPHPCQHENACCQQWCH